MEKTVAAKLLRVSSWLRETSLFKEAWLHVVNSKVNWWWSVEICTFCVGVMALQFRQQGMSAQLERQNLFTYSSPPSADKRKTVPHLWAYMILGQTVAISVAWNLVEAAIEMRDWLRGTSELLARCPPDADPAPLKYSSENEESASSEEASDDEGPSEESSVESSSTSEEESYDKPTRPSKRSNLCKAVWTDFTIHSRPRYGDLLFSLVMLLAGLVSVYRTPASIVPILFMHLCPLLLLLPIPLPTAPIPERWRGILSTLSLYIVIAAFSIVIRLKSHWDAWPQTGRLIPAFTSHPAQSSISADAVCLVLSVMDSLVQGNKSRRDSPWILPLLVPVLGPSAVLAIHKALEHKRRQQGDKVLWERMDEDEQYRHKDMIIREDFVTTYRSINNTSEDEGDKKAK